MMEIHDYLEKKRNIQEGVLNFIDNGINLQDDSNLISLFQEQNIGKNPYELKELLHLIASIANNYHRSLDFFRKIDQIIFFFNEEIKSTFSNFEIFMIFIKSKRILLFLFENKIITPDKFIVNVLQQKKYLSKNYNNYFYPEIKSFLSEKNQQEFKCDLLSENPEKFEQMRKIGENDNYVCQLIQNDSINEFSIYVNKTNLSLSSKIQSSIFETNSYIIKCNPTLIKYAAFFGSIQIFKFLMSNKIELTPSIWIYAIHGRNKEIIQILKDNNIKPKDNSYIRCFKEAIRFHNNKLANIFKENFLREKNVDVFEQALQYYNYSYFPNEINQTVNVLFTLCEYDYISLVDFLLKSKSMNVNESILV